MAVQRGDGYQGVAYVNGKRRRQQFRTMAEALEFERIAKEGPAPDEMIEVQEVHPIGKLFRRFYKEQYVGKADEKNAQRITEEIIARFGEETPLADIKPKLVKEWKDDLIAKRGNKKGTVNRKLSFLSRYLTMAEEANLIDIQPRVKQFKQEKGRIHELTPEQEGRILSQLRERDYYFALFLAGSGCRGGETKLLTWADVQADQFSLYHTKTGEPRSLPQTAQVKASLDYFRTKRKPQDKGPFTRVSYQQFMRKWKDAKPKAGIHRDDRNYTPYVLRHTVATRLARSGFSEVKLSQWMGHTSLDMTRRYIHLNVKDLVSGADTLSSFARAKKLSTG